MEKKEEKKRVLWFVVGFFIFIYIAITVPLYVPY